ncbi:hypothetical protein [Microbulbifer zhoushanensis]|uniref:hypothetical protein n=1 Tax=Microbulbifer TaxID=48073 RepID=UPI001F213C98|nr:hypothetical protein [Microbulbifer zhoushanensis]
MDIKEKLRSLNRGDYAFLTIIIVLMVAPASFALYVFYIELLQASSPLEIILISLAVSIPFIFFNGIIALTIRLTHNKEINELAINSSLIYGMTVSLLVLCLGAVFAEILEGELTSGIQTAVVINVVFSLLTIPFYYGYSSEPDNVATNPP